jgi:hypothetical protein
MDTSLLVSIPCPWTSRFNFAARLLSSQPQATMARTKALTQPLLQTWHKSFYATKLLSPHEFVSWPNDPTPIGHQHLSDWFHCFTLLVIMSKKIALFLFFWNLRFFLPKHEIFISVFDTINSVRTWPHLNHSFPYIFIIYIATLIFAWQKDIEKLERIDLDWACPSLAGQIVLPLWK